MVNRLLLMCFQVGLYGVDMLKYRSVCVLLVETFLEWSTAIAKKPSLSGYQTLAVGIKEGINLFQRPPLEFGLDMPIPISATITATLPTAFHGHAFSFFFLTNIFLSLNSLFIGRYISLFLFVSYFPPTATTIFVIFHLLLDLGVPTT